MNQDIRRLCRPEQANFVLTPVALCAVMALHGAAMAQQTPAPAATPTTTAASGEATTITITGIRTKRISTGATGLPLDIKETPQSISIVTAEQLQDFRASTINDALRLAPGVTVDAWETNRTSYTIRGFDVANTQVDGVGMPNGWGIVTGAVDTYGYEKVEVIRGANGLLTGVGNAAGTINFVRKRPTNDKQGEVNLSYGSWNTMRVEADYSTPLNQDRTWAARIVAAGEKGDSWLRSNEKKRTFVYGVIDGQIGDNGVLTLGYSNQQDNSTGVMWGALSFGNSDGTQARWNRDASTTQDWTKWDTGTDNAFVEYAHQLAGDWQLKATYNHRVIKTDTKLFYAYLAGAGGLDPQTGAGLAGYAGRGKDKRTEDMAEVSLSGSFRAWGRKHELLLGAGAAKARFDYDGYTSDCSASAAYDPYGFGCTYLIMPSFPYPGNLIAEPVWGDVSTAAGDLADYTEKRNRLFGSTRLALTDQLKGIIGFNYGTYKRNGNSFGTPLNQDDSKLSPYLGLTYDFTGNVLGYLSYSDIYQPQSQVDANNNYLAPSKGTNIEAGVKADWMDKRLLTTVAVFSAKQTGLAVPTGQTNAYGQAIYEAADYVKSEGVELEAVGKVSESIDLSVGFTHLKLSDRDGDSKIMPWVPRRTATLSLTGRLPAVPGLKLGVSGRWQSDISNTESSGITVRQDSYLVLGAFAAYQVSPAATVRFNVNNLTDKTYINTLRYAGYYGAPRNYQVSLGYKF